MNTNMPHWLHDSLGYLNTVNYDQGQKGTPLDVVAQARNLRTQQTKEDAELETSLGCRLRLCLKKVQKEKETGLAR